MENDSHDTQKDVQGAKVIDFTYHYNRRVAEKMTRQIGKAALGRPSYDIKRPFSGRLAPVYDISSRFPKTTTPEAAAEEDVTTGEQDTEREVIAEMMTDITTNFEALPEYDGDLGGFLDIINDQLEDCYEELSPDQKKKLAITLTSVLSDECHENISRAVVHHPNLVKILGVALYMQYDPLFQAMKRHPSYQPTDKTKTIEETSRKAADILSLTPGEYDFDTGAYTPPRH
jgi:hypothetical protein